MIRRTCRLLFLLICLSACGCSLVHQEKLKVEFDRSVTGYNKMLRWQEMELAGIEYLDSGLRVSFMKSVEELKKRGVTIVDYRILTRECRAEKESGEVLTEFDYFILPSNRLKTLTYRQAWEYRPDEGWRVRDSLPPFE